MIELMDSLKITIAMLFIALTSTFCYIKKVDFFTNQRWAHNRQTRWILFFVFCFLWKYKLFPSLITTTSKRTNEFLLTFLLVPKAFTNWRLTVLSGCFLVMTCDFKVNCPLRSYIPWDVHVSHFSVPASFIVRLHIVLRSFKRTINAR